MTPEFVLRSFNVKYQMRNDVYRAACLETLEPGDVVQAVSLETGEVVGTRLLDAVDKRREAGGGTREDWPQRYLAGDWRADDEGHQLDEGQERVEMGWVLVRPPLTHQEAQALLVRTVVLRPPFSWARYERHMRLTHVAVQHGFGLPDEDWA